MLEVGWRMLGKLREALPGARVYWESEPELELKGAVLSAELKQRKFTVAFDRIQEDHSPETLDDSLVEQVVDDFVDFFARSIYPREKFTRII